MRVSKPAGTVQITATSHDAHAMLSITNTVENFDRADIVHLFDRFWRKDAARTDSAHSGLGLSIVSEFAKLLKTPLSVKLIDPATLAIFLALPSEKIGASISLISNS